MRLRLASLICASLAATTVACSIRDLPPQPHPDAILDVAASEVSELGSSIDGVARDGAGGTDARLGDSGTGGRDAMLGGAGGAGTMLGGAGGADTRSSSGGMDGGLLGQGGAGGADARTGTGGRGGSSLTTGGTGGVDAPLAGGGSGGTGTGGAASTGGSTGVGGATGTGGRTGSGGATGTGGLPGTGGLTGTGGLPGTGGAGTGGAGTGGAGTGGSGGSTCVPQDDTALCASLGVSCGPATGQDNCGNVRSVGCGACGTCADPIVVPTAGGSFTGTTSGTGTRSSTCGGATAPEKVFAWTPTVSGLATVNTCGSSFDTVLDVASGACASSTSVACNNDSPDWCGTFGPTTSSVAFTATAGTTYYFTLDGAGTASGSYALLVASAEGSCTVPYEIPAAGISAHYYLSGSSTDSATCGGSGYDRVHHWRPSVSGTAHVTVVPDFWPSTLYVRSGSCKGTELACDNQTGQWPTNNLAFAVTAGTDYYVWVSHGQYNGQYVNQYTLTATAPAAP